MIPNLQALESETKVKQVYVPAYNRKTSKVTAQQVSKSSGFACCADKLFLLKVIFYFSFMCSGTYYGVGQGLWRLPQSDQVLLEPIQEI